VIENVEKGLARQNLVPKNRAPGGFAHKGRGMTVKLKTRRGSHMWALLILQGRILPDPRALPLFVHVTESLCHVIWPVGEIHQLNMKSSKSHMAYGYNVWHISQFHSRTPLVRGCRGIQKICPKRVVCTWRRGCSNICWTTAIIVRPLFRAPYFAIPPISRFLRAKFFIPTFCNPVNFPLMLDYFRALLWPLMRFLSDNKAPMSN